MHLSVFYVLSCLVDMDAVFEQWRMFRIQRSSRGGGFCMQDWVQAIEQEHFSLALAERCSFIVLMQMMNHFLMLYMAVILCSWIYNLHFKGSVK